MKNLPQLVTDRLILRSFKYSDADALYEYAKSEKIGPRAGWKPHDSVEESLKIIKMFHNEFAVWAIVLKDTDKIIGSIGLSRNNRISSLRYDLEIGIALSETSWGRGIAVEACREVLKFSFEVLKCNTIFASHFSDNVQSKRVIEKLGFVFQKTLKDSWKNFDGKFFDEEGYILQKSRYLFLNS